MKNCENCIHAAVCRTPGEPCEHHMSESPAIHTLRLIYADFMAGANQCRTRAEACSLHGKSHDANNLLRQAEIRTSLASRVKFWCRKIGFDPSANG